MKNKLYLLTLLSTVSLISFSHLMNRNIKLVIGIQNVLLSGLCILKKEEEVEKEVEEVATPNITDSIYRLDSTKEPEDSWVDNLLFSSCFIAGKKGSGKSHLMRYLAGETLLRSNPERDIVYIIDPHYDSDTPWFLGLDESRLVENGRISKNGIHTILSLQKTLEERIENGLKLTKVKSRIVIFIDEVDSFTKKELTEVVIPFLTKCEYEGRKYGFFVVVGSHTIKKSILQLDSSVTSSMNCIFFGNILLDRNNVFSGVLPSISEMKNEIEYYRNTFKQTRIVGLVINDEFRISHVPDLKHPEFKIYAGD